MWRCCADEPDPGLAYLLGCDRGGVRAMALCPPHGRSGVTMSATQVAGIRDGPVSAHPSALQQGVLVPEARHSREDAAWMAACRRSALGAVRRAAYAVYAVCRLLGSPVLQGTWADAVSTTRQADLDIAVRSVVAPRTRPHARHARHAPRPTLPTCGVHGVQVALRAYCLLAGKC